MSDPGRFVEIHAATPAAAACAAVLDRAGVSVRIIDSEPRTVGLAAVSRELLSELGLDGSRLGKPVETIIDRTLAEDDAMDKVREPGSVSLVDRLEIVESLTSGIERATDVENESRAFSIGAGEFRLGDPDLLDDGILPHEKTLECILLDWDGARIDRASWFRLTGEGLADVDATASILTSHVQTSLILTVPMASIVETSISVVDVLARLLAHPSVRNMVPEMEPRTASTRLMRTGEPVHITLRGGARVRIGAAAGLADPVRLDRELRSGTVAAEQIAQAVTGGRLTLARLSRIGRVWSAIESDQAVSS
ncbi:MAG TPA: hypothetical protein VHR64_09955 [Thermomicrobiales bacterium]|nr:hypothetical protein [Thermomicrobiales bacterium]